MNSLPAIIIALIASGIFLYSWFDGLSKGIETVCTYLLNDLKTPKLAAGKPFEGRELTKIEVFCLQELNNEWDSSKTIDSWEK